MKDTDFTPRKDPHQSKTVWWGLLQPLLLAIPGAPEFVSNNPEVVGVLSGVVTIALRYLTRSSIK